ncbi:MAG: hypothetical protein Q7T97_11870 [Burkholderiaceae bacterium]|nr:hypothetical protein [Burkholderiaceae bacterium]
MDRKSLRVSFVLVAIAAIAVWFGWAQHRFQTQPPLLLAPMFNVFDPCNDLLATPAGIGNCNQPGGSPAKLIENTLSKLGPRFSSNGQFELGYTLHIPLLRLLKQEGTQWTVDLSAVKRMIGALHDDDRPAIVYFFSTHFQVGAPIEAVLASDPGNLSESSVGPMSRDKYYGDAIYPWTFATTENELTRRRVQVIDALVDEICKLSDDDRQKIRGITLLGELHHLFPNFQGGMGFQEKYLVSDYSRASLEGFRIFLAKRYGTVSALNQALSSDYVSFGAVDPPSKDIRTQPLTRFTEHIDSYAHGTLPISGWLNTLSKKVGEKRWIRVYRNGEFIERVPVNLSRQDVLEAHPEFGTADVGWRFDLDFSALMPGVHRIDVILEGQGDAKLHLGTRYISVMERNQATPRALPEKALPTTQPPDATLIWSVDYPIDQSSYYFNPLVQLWHEFRASQIVTYLQFIDQRVRRTCLKDVDTYVHQITPFSNPSWDANKFAVGASLQPLGAIHLGVSLYGEPTYGSSFFDWYARSQHKTYGVTEFHPLREMSLDEAREMFKRHRSSGAQFLSFFLKTEKLLGTPSGDPNQFAFDPDNPKFGSDHLYRTVKALVNE